MDREIIIDGIKNYHFIKQLKNVAEHTPDKIAVRGMGEAFTYRQLDLITEAIGEALVKKGLTPNKIVAVIHERHVNVILAAIGCWKARVGYFYLDTKMPDYQKQQRLADSDCEYIIKREFIEELKEKVLRENYVAEELPVGDMDDIAWILYTSGSSGVAKGVILRHCNISVHMNIANTFRTTENSVQSMMASFSFMSGLLEGFPILYQGGTLTMVPNEYRRNWRQIVDFLREEKVTIAFVPSHYAEQIVKENLEIPSLKVLFTGGEPVHNLKAETYDIYCVYGSSECGGPVTCCKIQDSREEYPIGEAIPMARVYLLKENSMELVEKAGEIGEICISGRQICDGYLKRDDLNVQKFSRNPFTDDPNYAVIYRTGDLGRLDENGDIYYAARADLMCKIKSFRIEIGTVEAELLKYPGIERCVVKPLIAPDGEKELHGFYYADKELDKTELKTYLRDKLNHYMVPVDFHRLEQIYIMDNGKVDRSKVHLEGYRE